MAGFINRLSAGNVVDIMRSSLAKFARLGIRYDDMVIKQSYALGAKEGAARLAGSGSDDEDFLYSLAQQDTGNSKYIAYYAKDYATRRDFLRTFASNSEIETILEIVTDECIVLDEQQRFCYPSKIENAKEDIQELFEDNFDKIYNYWKFNDANSAWDLMKQFLTDGIIAFEIVWDENMKRIIGFKELDAVTLEPGVEPDETGKMRSVWYQFQDDPKLMKKMLDVQIIYISFAKDGQNRFSYLERLVRSFNLMRVMETTRVSWAVMNSSFRMKMVVPVGTKSKQKAHQSVAAIQNFYKEDARLDNESGELTVNGKPNIPFYKNYVFPSKNGEQIDISAVGGDGPELSDMGQVEYFKQKLKEDSRVPLSRFSSGGQASGSTYQSDNSNVERDEIRFSRFVNRLRSIYQEIMMKPLYLQMIMDKPELAEDELFKSKIGIRFNKDNYFDQIKQQEINKKQSEFVEAMAAMAGADGTPFFNKDVLINFYLQLPPELLEMNQTAKDKAKGNGDATAAATPAADAFGIGDTLGDGGSEFGTDASAFSAPPPPAMDATGAPGQTNNPDQLGQPPVPTA